MPPRKPINNGEPKILRSRTKKNNVKITTPEFKVTIPLQNVPIVFENQRQAETPMPGKNDIKIMLANEVVRRQFPKKKTLIDEPNGLISKVNTNKIIKKSPLIGKQKLMQKNKNSEVTKKNRQGKVRQKAGANNNNTTVLESVPCEDKQLEETKEPIVDEKKKETKKPVKLRRNRTIKKSALPPPIDDNKVKEINSHPTSSNVVIKRKIGPRPSPRTRKKVNQAKETENTEIKTNESQQDVIDTENPLNTRRLSVAGSELSWTKDISSSSTTTCVTVSSKDFFRIDKKIPVIKLTNIDKKLKSDEHVNNTENDKQENVDTELHGLKTADLQLSSSSSSSSSSRTNQEPGQDVQNTQDLTILDKLASKLKSFDLEIMNWIGYGEQKQNSDVNKIQDKVFNENFLHEERDLMLHCQSINRILSEYSHRDENCHNLIEANVETNNNISENIKEATIERSEQNINNIEIKPNQVEDKIAHNSTYNDEDDALSLYAESITDMESPRNLSQKSRENIEEYVPVPANNEVFKRPEKMIYKPTKIKKIVSKEPENPMEIGICEKSNADSTSTNKENNESACDENVAFYEDRLGEVEKAPENPIQSESILMAVNQKPKQGIYSAVFKGICIFNLATNCKNIICKFPHKFLDKDDIRLRLRKLDDQLFQEEYIFLRAWSSLRRLYSICFVEDCIRRKLTRVLIEMTLDIVNKSYYKEDGTSAVEAVETTLVYLNDIELQAYGDLLMYKVKNNRLLCDVFMATIAKSQNFSRFKPIFIKLTDFMCKLESSFESDMVSHVLERVCILPFDFNLARALVKVIKNTDFKIFCNSMMKNFEQQLLFSSAQLYEELRVFKEEYSKSLRDSNCYNSPLDSDTERLNNQSYSENDIRYSPDTTNLDSHTKTTIEPKFKRTVDLNKLKLFNDAPNSSSSESDDKYTYRHYNTWQNNMQSNNRNTMEVRNPMMPPLRRAFKRRSDQAFGFSPNKFPRRSGPSFF